MSIFEDYGAFKVSEDSSQQQEDNTEEETSENSQNKNGTEILNCNKRKTSENANTNPDEDKMCLKKQKRKLSRYKHS